MSQEETSETSFEEVDPRQADGSGEEGWQEPPWEWGSRLILEPTRAWHTVGHLRAGCGLSHGRSFAVPREERARSGTEAAPEAEAGPHWYG